jgi:hypothetical protein
MSSDLISKSLALLGMNAKDRVTGFQGVVSSVTFDAYGCVQALLTPKYVDNKHVDSLWFDVKRVLPDSERVMPVPDFDLRYGEERGGNQLPGIRSAPVPR